MGHSVKVILIFLLWSMVWAAGVVHASPFHHDHSAPSHELKKEKSHLHCPLNHQHHGLPCPHASQPISHHKCSIKSDCGASPLQSERIASSSFPNMIKSQNSTASSRLSSGPVFPPSPFLYKIPDSFPLSPPPKTPFSI